MCAVVVALLAAPVTPLRAQPRGTLLATPVVHELRAVVPALSRATLNAPNIVTNGAWMSSIDAVTNVAIDVLLLAPTVDEQVARAVHVRDADGVYRRWSDGPIVVARALKPGRHRVVMRWDANSLGEADRVRVLARMQTATRAASTGE